MIVATVLIVEDDVPVRRIAAEILRAHGISVLLAVDGPDAIQVASLFNDVVDLILADVMLPHINGPEVVRRIKATRPDVDAVYMSGYPLVQLVANGVDVPGDRLLEKPFTSTQLIGRVRERLQSAAH